jgi:hypothetical protein
MIIATSGSVFALTLTGQFMSSGPNYPLLKGMFTNTPALPTQSYIAATAGFNIVSAACRGTAGSRACTLVTDRGTAYGW